MICVELALVDESTDDIVASLVVLLTEYCGGANIIGVVICDTTDELC